MRAFGQHVVAEQRHQHDGREPRHDQRDRRYLEDRARVFAGARFRERDRQEARHGDERAREHRERRARVRECRGARTAPALFELHGHHFDGDDRVVHQQPEREHQRAERHLVQADAEYVHAERRHRKHDRNRDDHDHAGAQAERHEAHDEHDRDGFADRFDEVVHRVLDRVRHARHRRQLQAGRQARLQLGGFRVERLAEVDHVAAFLHRDADAEHRVAVRPHLRDGRIVVAARDGRDVAQPERAAVHGDEHVGERLRVLERAARPNEHTVVRGRDGAGRRDGILCVDRLRELLRRDREARQLRVRDLDEHVLGGIAEVVDLRGARHTQQRGAQPVRIVVQLRGRIAVAFQRVDIGVHVAEFIVEERADGAFGQCRADVADLLAHLVPGLRYLVDRRRILHREEDHRLAGARIALDVVDVRRRLQLAADPVRDLFLHVARRRAGPVGLDHHRAKRERRILRLRETRIADHAEDRREADQEDHQLLVLQRPCGQVEAVVVARRGSGLGAMSVAGAVRSLRSVHDARSSACSGGTMRTCWPALTVWTPCITTRSSFARPDVTVTVRSS